MNYVCAACGESADREGVCSADGQPLVASQDPVLGTEIGRYRIARLLGVGGMGRVYLGVQPMIGSRVAIKILSVECSRMPDLLERFFAEARAVNLIRHESIVSVIDMAQLSDGRPYIVMEFIEGRTLGEIARGGPTPIGGVVQVATEMLSALGAAHALGIVHRDLKPDNVLVTAEGHAKVLDFGIAKLAPGVANMMSPRTATGALLGTPAYMAPEQISGAENVDARTDLYAAGVVLFEAITGRTPFLGETLYDLMKAHLETPPPSPRALRPDLPAGIERVILTALEKDPTRRYQSAADMTHALHDAARELPADQWRVLSRGGMLTGRPSLDHMRHNTPSGPAHAPTVRASMVVAPPTERDRPRRSGLAIGIAALAAVAIGIVLVVMAVTGGDEAAPTPPPVAVAIEVPQAGAPPVTPPLVVAPPAAPIDAPPLPPKQAAPPPTKQTAPPEDTHDQAGSGSAGAPAGPTVRGGGSAADHGVIVGPNVTTGPNVVIGSDPAPTRTTFTRPIDYNPKKFDGAAYAKKALALAQSVYPDARLASYQIYNVFPSGLADLGLTDATSSYLFRSPSHSARPPGPKNVDPEIPCYVEVTVGVREIEVRVRSNSSDENCKWPLRSTPSCSHAGVWTKAKAAGADLDTVASISLYHDGTWYFSNSDDGTGVSESYADHCP